MQSVTNVAERRPLGEAPPEPGTTRDHDVKTTQSTRLGNLTEPYCAARPAIMSGLERAWPRAVIFQLRPSNVERRTPNAER